MPIVESISNFRLQTKRFTTQCKEQDEPIFLTSRNEGDFVLMSKDYYERLNSHNELFSKLDVAEKQSSAGEKGITHSQMIKKLRKHIREA